MSAVGSAGRQGAGRCGTGSRRPGGSSRPTASGSRISFTPALPDGADCPWTRERRTRWWLVVPSDSAGAVLVALFGAAATRTLGDPGTPIWQALLAVAVGWAVAWLVRRSRPDHLEMAVPDGLLVIATAWIVWGGLHLAVGQGGAGGDGGSAGSAGAGGPGGQSAISWAVMTGAFLLAFLGGWRWLYGYVRAHDSLVPAPLARRIAAQESDDAADAENAESAENAGCAGDAAQH